MKKRFCLLALCILCLNFILGAQNNIDGTKAWEHVRYLSSNELKGRKSGTIEYKKAAEYVAHKMQEYGLKPGGDNNTYFQDVPFKNWSNWEQPIKLVVSEPQLRTYFAGSNRDFMPLRYTGSGALKAKLAFVGYGIETEQPGWNDYENIDVSGRIVMIYPGTPLSLSSKIAGNWDSDNKIKKAIEKGAIGAILVNPITTNNRRGGIRIGRETCPDGFVAISVGQNFIKDMFYMANKSLGYTISKTIRENKSYSVLFDTMVEMEAHYVSGDKTAPNVIGIIPGTDKKLKDEYIVIGGHLDHLGVNIDGFVYNGADDNAVSAGVILELARIFQVENFRPARTIVFTSWAGEELGLVGSRYYVSNPPFPLEKTCLYINLDMAGAGDRDLVVGGMYNFLELFEIIKESMDEDMKKRLVYRLNYRGSDHAAFLSKGINAISLRTGNVLTRQLDDEHPEYHRPGDLVEYIDPEVLAYVTKYHYDILHNLANTDKNLLDPYYYDMYTHRSATVVDLNGKTGSDAIDVAVLKKAFVDIQLLSIDLDKSSEQENISTSFTESLTEIKKGILRDKKQENIVFIQNYTEIRSLGSTDQLGIIIGVKVASSILSDLSVIKKLFDSGARFMTINEFDGSTKTFDSNNGLALSGKKVIEEMNSLGMLINLSGLNNKSCIDVLNISKKPVIITSTGCNKLSKHKNNITDGLIKKIAEKNGVIGISFNSELLNSKKPDKANIKTLVDHIDYIVKLTGEANNVGLGFGYNGDQKQAAGLENVEKIYNITMELKSRKYSDRDIKKILGANFLRVFRSQN